MWQTRWREFTAEATPFRITDLTRHVPFDQLRPSGPITPWGIPFAPCQEVSAEWFGELGNLTATVLTEPMYVPLVRYRYQRPATCGMVWVEVAARLIQTRPYFGGTRWWFICPRCGRRCGVLYVPGDIKRDDLRCRLCHRLKYRSQNS